MSQFAQSNIATAAALGLVGFALGCYASSTPWKARDGRKAIASPLSSLLPELSESQIANLPYPPDFFPGARDVCTPYGKMRVYEWGPTTGKKVIMVPGDTSPAPVFGVIAKGLVERGFRVLVLDTWGRGYSDSPLTAPHDIRLFALQIIFALVSSPLSWTGTSDGFSVIGFSLGGSITMYFASYFPNLITSIILLAPAGVMRSPPEGYSSIFLRKHQWTPYSYLRKIVASVIGVNPQKQAISISESVASKRVSIEAPDLPALWQWQFDTHEGFVYSFADTVQNNPLLNQEQEWRKVCDIICGKDTDPEMANCKLRSSQIRVICGESDRVVIADETEKEFSRLLPDRVEFRAVPGGHGFPIPSGEATLQHIYKFWDLHK